MRLFDLEVGGQEVSDLVVLFSPTIKIGRGVKVADGLCMNRKYLKPEQKELLEQFGAQLSGNDLTIINSSFKDFALSK